MRRREVLQPQRVLNDRIASQARSITMRAEKGIDGLEGDFKAPESEGRVRARVQPDVHQLVVIEHDVRIFADASGNLRVAGRSGIAVPVSAHSDAGAIDRPQIDRTL